MSTSGDEPMASESHALLNQRPLPTVAGANALALFQKALALLGPREPLELRPQGMVRRQERLLTVKDRRVVAVCELARASPERLEVDRQRTRQGWVGIGLKVGVA